MKGQGGGRRAWVWPFGADLGPRIVSAVILIPVSLFGLFLGGIWFALLVGAVFAGGHHEFQTMTGGRPARVYDIFLTALIPVSALIQVLLGAVMGVAVISFGIGFALLAGGGRRWWDVAGLVFFGAVVFALIAIRGEDMWGFHAGLFLGATVWLTDTGAYFTGRILGGAKLSPDISPSKTWSGAIGGLVTGSALALLVWVLATPSQWWIGAAFGIGLSIVGQLGDLAESGLKRRFRIKDSGEAIPGHGGLMDRLDSLSFAALVLFAIGLWHGGWPAIAAGFLVWP
ncbi:MAG: phosphatidate cytidylyltransferase [Alphaproteobacteria bacterium]|nr:phosphatidate cytidylyltransferase [Alphaproteobacteria bacterium]